MTNKISIIMYHYVRDLKNSKYPEIKGLDISLFKEQLQYILKYYVVIRMEDLINAVRFNKQLPDNSLLLTFDDGYKDHFDFVFPILKELGVQGSFFPSAKAIQENQVLDVNKIHFILASVENKNKIISDIYSMLDKYRIEYSLKTNEFYYDNLAKIGRFDTPEIVFIKELLQKELPEKLRKIIVNVLFSKYVFEDENSFSRELYMSINELKLMKDSGMYIGSHGYDHYWLNTLSKEQQDQEIKLSLNFLKKIGTKTNNFAFCYPYGIYNDSLLSVLKENGCCLALTTDIDIADLTKNKSFLLPRLDTNHLPKDSNAKPNEWTVKVINLP